jgi:hypothetical protein
MDEIFRKYKEILENKHYYDVVFEPVDGKSYSIYSVQFNKDIDETYKFNEKQQEAINTAYEQMVPNRSTRLLGHSGLGYGTNATKFLSRKELNAYQSTCTSCNKAARHKINTHNFLEIIYVYENYTLSEAKGNFFSTREKFIQDEFIKYTVRKLLGSKDREIDAYCAPIDLRIVASKIPIEDVKSTKRMLQSENDKLMKVERDLVFLGQYVMKNGNVEKHAFKPRKLKKPSRAKVSKSAQKRHKSKSKRSPKPHRR